MATESEQYFDSLTAKGKISFTMNQFCRELKISSGASLVALSRLKQERRSILVCDGCMAWTASFSM